MPVVTPVDASTETVKSVRYISRFCATIRCSPSCSARSFEIGTQINPRPCIAMKLIAFGVAFSAAITRSPSFSRSASSVTITILPAAMSRTTSSIGVELKGYRNFRDHLPTITSASFLGKCV